MPIVAALLIAAALILLIDLVASTVRPPQRTHGIGTYDSEGTVVFGYTLFALALALASASSGAEQSPPSPVAFVGYFAARIFVDTWLRTRLVSPLKATWHTAAGQPANLDHANIISQTGSGPGVVVGNGVRSARNDHVHVAVGVGPTTMHAVYQPASDFWPLQGLETALFGGVALILIAFAAWWTHQRTT